MDDDDLDFLYDRLIGKKWPHQQLLPREIMRQLPSIEDAEAIPPEERTVFIKILDPETEMAWYVCACNGADELYGYIQDDRIGGWHRFSFVQLLELATDIKKIRAPEGPPIGRDALFRPTKFKDLEIRPGAKISRSVMAG